jgi:hypothetical protein
MGAAGGALIGACDAAGIGSLPRDDPHFGQNAKSAEHSVPQDGHTGWLFVPHFGQKAKSADISNPQPVQLTSTLDPSAVFGSARKWAEVRWRAHILSKKL